MTTAVAAAPARRPGLLAGTQQALTVTWRSVLKIRTSLEDVFGLSLNPIVFLLLFTYVFGGALAGSSHAYLQFALPGILVYTVVLATLGTGLRLNTDISTGVFDRFRSLPIARWAPLAGAIGGDLARYVISVAITIGFGMVLGFRVGSSPLAAAAGCLLVKTPAGVQTLGFLVTFPLVFGSNLFVSPAKMPGWLQAFVRVNPMTDLTSAARGLMVSGPVAVPALKSLAWAVGFVVVFAPSRSRSTAARPEPYRAQPHGPERRRRPSGRSWRGRAGMRRTRPGLIGLPGCLDCPVSLAFLMWPGTAWPVPGEGTHGGISACFFRSRASGHSYHRRRGAGSGCLRGRHASPGLRLLRYA